MSSLTEGDIKSALETQAAAYRYRDVPYTGDGAVVSGVAIKGSSRTLFAVISGDPQFHARLLPDNVPVQTGVIDDDLVLKIGDTRKRSVDLSVAMEFALCRARVGHPCDV